MGVIMSGAAMVAIEVTTEVTDAGEAGEATTDAGEATTDAGEATEAGEANVVVAGEEATTESETAAGEAVFATVTEGSIYRMNRK